MAIATGISSSRVPSCFVGFVALHASFTPPIVFFVRTKKMRSRFLRAISRCFIDPQFGDTADAQPVDAPLSWSSILS